MTHASITARPVTLDAVALQERLSLRPPPRVLDVRTPTEFETVHIPGSYNVPLDTLKEHRQEILDHLDEDVVLVCRSGQRAAEAERTLAAAGLVNVHVLDGGIVAWQRRGGSVNRGRERWDLERQVRLAAGSLVLAGVLGGTVFPPARLLAGFVGGGLTIAALSNTCAMGRLLSRLPYNRGVSCDVQAVVAELAASQPEPSRP